MNINAMPQGKEPQHSHASVEKGPHSDLTNDELIDTYKKEKKSSVTLQGEISDLELDMDMLDTAGNDFVRHTQLLAAQIESDKKVKNLTDEMVTRGIDPKAHTIYN